MKRCARCEGSIAGHRFENCWFCDGALCMACWEVFGHCGHPLAESASKRAQTGTYAICAVCHEPPRLPTIERPDLACRCLEKQ